MNQSYEIILHDLQIFTVDLLLKLYKRKENKKWVFKKCLIFFLSLSHDDFHYNYL